MTYCVAMKLQDGLVFVADSRTNAGVDNIATFRKLHLFRIPGERLIVIQSAGNLATSQAVIGLLRQRLDSEQDNLHGVPTLYDAARLLGQTLREVLQRDAEDAPSGHGLDLSCSFLLGGQIRGAEPELFNLYPHGNFIIATEDTPYFQIGESKYGKPILDRALTFATPLEEALRCALLSYDATIRSNLSVGLPLDLVVYPRDRLAQVSSHRIDEQDPYCQALRKGWGEGLRDLLAALPAAPADYWR